MFTVRRYSPDYKGCTVFSGSYAPSRFGCVAERKLISPTKLKTISTFCTRFPSTFFGTWTMIFLIDLRLVQCCINFEVISVRRSCQYKAEEGGDAGSIVD